MIDLLYGDTMSGKSRAIEALIRYLLKDSDKKARVYLGDGGGDSYNAHGLVDAGKIELFDYSSREWPMTIVKLMGDLYWPKDWRDSKSLLEAPKADLFDKYAIIVTEGGTVMGEYLLSDIPGGMAWQAAEQTGFGGVKDEADNLSTTDKLSGATYAAYTAQGANAPRHWQIVQRKLLAAIRAQKKFPGMVLWTAHPTEAPDKTEGGASGQYGKITGRTIIGPDFGGKAKASLISKEFGNTLHFDTVAKEEREKDDTTQKSVKTLGREFRIYTRRHFDPTLVVNTEYIAGNRAPNPEAMPEFFVSKEPGDALLQFYQTLKAQREANINKQRGDTK